MEPMATTIGAESLNTLTSSHSVGGTPQRNPKAIVTGARVGLGFEVARQLLSLGIDVVITGREQKAVDAATKKLAIQNPNRQVTGLALELGDLEQVSQFSQLPELEGWEILVNNAGAKIESPYKSTRQGFEWHFGVNHLSHHLLTSLLLPKASVGARVVSVASIMARTGGPELWSLNGQSTASLRHFNPGALYAASKLANLAFAMKLDQLNIGVRAACAHPGFAKAEPYGSPLTRIGENLLAQSAASGARPIVAAATNPLQPSFGYFGPQVFELWGKPRAARLPAVLTAHYIDDLWELSNELSGANWPSDLPD